MAKLGRSFLLLIALLLLLPSFYLHLTHHHGYGKLAAHAFSLRETISDSHIRWPGPPARRFERAATTAANVSQESSSARSEAVARNESGSSDTTITREQSQEGAKKLEQLAAGLLRQPASQANNTAGGATGVFKHIRVTAIHVDRSEFPLSKLLFKLTLRLALEEANRFLGQQAFQLLQAQQRAPGKRNQQQQQRQRQPEQLRQLVRVQLKLSVRSANTCSRQFAGALAAEEFYMKRSRLFIVSGCDDAIKGVSRLASQWRVPILTAAGFGVDLDDKRVHKTLVRVAFSLRAAVEFLFKILRSFQWRRVNLVVDQSDSNSLALRGSIEELAAKSVGLDQFQVSLNTISFDLQSLIRDDQATSEPATLVTRKSSGNFSSPEADDDGWPNELSEKVVRDTLRSCSIYSRVTILLIPQEFMRKFMLAAYDQRMANGMYTFISMPLLAAAAAAQESEQSAGPASRGGGGSAGAKRMSYTASTGEEAFIWRSVRSRRNAQARVAFESLMSIYLRTPTTKAYVYFASKLLELANSQRQPSGPSAPAPNVAPSSEHRIISAHQKTGLAPLTPRAAAAGDDRSRTARRGQLNINPYSASFYDGLQIYAQALNESLTLLASDGSGRQGAGELHARISELVRNKRFENMVTGSVYINQNGDRETDYTLDDMNQMTGKFAPVILFRGETRDIVRLGRIHWSSDTTVGPTSDIVDCALVGTCVGKPMSRFNFVLVLLAVPLALMLGGLLYFVQNKLSLESQLVDHWWKIHLSDLELVQTRRKNANDGSLVMGGEPDSVSGGASGTGVSNSFGTKSGTRRLAIESSSGRPNSGSLVQRASGLAGRSNRTEITKATGTSAGYTSSAMDACYGDIRLGIYKLSKVALKPISKFHQSRKLMIELRTLKDINHSNLCHFVGILVDEGSLALVSEFCPKGSLREFFHNESMVIDWTFKYSIINDILAGLLYLHSSPIAFHGRLKSSNCLVSARFVVKLSDYGPHSLYEQLDSNDLSDGGGSSESWLKNRIWLAPEHMKPTSRIGSMSGDVYSFGLLLYEIITNCLPFFNQEQEDYVMPLESLYQELRNKGPSELMAEPVAAIEADEEANSLSQLVELMQACWRFEPAKRPSSASVNGALKKITRGVTSKKLLENLTQRMEQYTNNLESLVDDKLACLLEEKQRSEELLYQFVPKSIASLLKEGQFVEPEAFDCVTVFYSDIVGFTSLSSESTPMEVVDFLSDLYLCFDGTLEQHDIFKVDTIGDAYIVASGLPQRNEGKHAIEIACAALELRDRLKQFKIPHKPGRSLEMRVGIHSGPCIAGIVGGLNMPKYCVFGDTLTTGKFMESSGLPMKIHITDESRLLLQNLPDFAIEPRVPKITRDGLPFQTFWLERAAM